MASVTKRCPKCGEDKELEAFGRDSHASSGRRSNCKACCATYQRRLQSEYKAKRGVWKSATYSYARTCEGCGQDFSSGESKARFCSNACHNRRRRWTRTCRHCGDQWEALAPTSLHCSEDCRRGAAMAARSQVAVFVKPPGWKRPRPARLLEVRIVRPLRKRWFAGQCVFCGTWWIHDQPTTQTCSPDCQRRLSRARRRAIQRNAFVAPVSPRKIFERDRWKCRLCGLAVKRDAVVPHPKAPVIDHIVPLAAGGTHEPANVQCAHFLCNCQKGAGGGGQLLLIG